MLANWGEPTLSQILFISKIGPSGTANLGIAIKSEATKAENRENTAIKEETSPFLRLRKDIRRNDNKGSAMITGQSLATPSKCGITSVKLAKSMRLSALTRVYSQPPDLLYIPYDSRVGQAFAFSPPLPFQGLDRSDRK